MSSGVNASQKSWDTTHFRCGQVSAGNLVLATPDTPSEASMAFFGQLNIPHARKIAAVHLHLIVTGSSGALTIEVYRARGLPGAPTYTKIATLTLTNAEGNMARASVVPTGDAALLEGGDYLVCQPTAKDLVTNGANGVTVDIHFASTV